jgi:hypothetical protein
MFDTLIAPEKTVRATIDATLFGSLQFSPAAGLAIYQRSFGQRLASCMREQFPALCHALGAALFDDFVADYIRAQPPESHTLYDLGRRFAAWLESERPDRDLPPEAHETWIDFIIDLARFEYALFMLFDAPGHEGRPFADPGTPDSDLSLQPAFTLAASRFPVAPYYHGVRLGENPDLPAYDDSFVALVRTDYVTRTVLVNQPEYVFLQVMMAGGSVGEALDQVAVQREIPLSDVRAAWPIARQRWINFGFFAARQ